MKEKGGTEGAGRWHQPGPRERERDTLIGPSALSRLVPERSLLSPVGAPGGGC